MATDNIFAGSIECDGFTNNGPTASAGAVVTDTGFVGPSLGAKSATGVGTAGNGMVVTATNGTANAGGTGGAGGSAVVSAGDGGNGTTGGAGGGLLLEAGGAGTGGNANGGDVTLLPGTPTGSGVRGSVVVSGPFRSPTGGAVSQAVGDDDPISLPTTGFNKKVATSTAANKVGVILAAGISDGQTICVINTSANSITFAAAGTSNVADGVSAVIPALRAMIFTWDATTARWYRQGA